MTSVKLSKISIHMLDNIEFSKLVKVHQYNTKLIQNEIIRRKQLSSTVPIIKKTKNTVTIKDMQQMLDKHNVVYPKRRLYSIYSNLIKKHRLVRKTREFSHMRFMEQSV